MPRAYTQRKRADAQAETRRRIVEAAIALHQDKGIAATSMRDIAEKAGVGTVTVYRHFGSEDEVVAACSGLYMDRNPLPDPEAWRGINDPEARLRRALAETYAYHRRTAPMFDSVLDEVRGGPVGEAYAAHWRQAASVLRDAWPSPMREDPALGAALSLMLRFETWRALTVEGGLSDDEAAGLMLRLVETPAVSGG